MTYKARLGHISGSRQQPTLPISVFDDGGATLGYDAALAFAIASAPTTIFGANLATADITITERSAKAIVFELAYNRPGRNILLREVDAQTQSKKLHHYIAPVSVRDAAGDASSIYSALETKPDRQGGLEEFNSGKPIVVDPLRNSRRLRFSTSQSFITDPYLDLVENLVDQGTFNSEIYLGREPGTLQLVQFSASENDFADWTLSFGFGFRAIRTNVDVGDGVIIPTLRGCDHTWNKEEEEAIADTIQPKVAAAITGQAWPLADLSVLNMPYPGTLTTRTSDTAGVITTLEGHGITGSDDCIIFWDGGVQVAAVSSVGGVSPASTISFGSGSGDALPPLNTNVLVAKYIP
jgi:hypothetical protein